MFPQEDRELHTDDVDDGEHVGEGHVGDDEEEGPVDAHDPGRGVLLAEVHGPQHEGDDHGLGDPNLHDERVLDDGEEAPPEEGSELFPPRGLVRRLLLVTGTN